MITGGGKPYRYKLNDISNQEIRYQFFAADLKLAPPKDQLQLTVDKIITRQDDMFVICQFLWISKVSERT